MINDVANITAGLPVSNATKANVAQKEITDSFIVRGDRGIEDKITLSPAAMKALEQNIANFNEKNEVYAEARAEVLSAMDLTEEEFYRLDSKTAGTTVTTIEDKFRELMAERMKEKIEAEGT